MDNQTNPGLTKLEELKLKYLREKFGPLTAMQALDLALDNEDLVRACGPFDPAAQYLIQSQLNMESYAFLLEKEENANAASAKRTV